MENQSEILSQLMMELYTNPELKDEFIANPKKVMAEKGIDIQQNIEIKVLEETETQKYIVLPHLSDNSDTFSEDLEKKISKLFYV